MRLAGVLIALLLIVCTGCATTPVYRRGVRHVVQRGQTLYRIGKTYNVPVSTIMTCNHIHDPTNIKVGRALFIPGVTYTRTVAVVPGKKRTVPTVSGKHKKYNKIKHKKVSKAKPVKLSKKKYVAAPKHTVKKCSSSAGTKSMRGRFVWPVRGRLIKKFNLAAKVPSKGIDIAAPVNYKVVSAAAGKVIYSGSGISGFGLVIIIEHDNSLYSVYGYNKKLLVKSGSYVSAGQKIALVGTPPGGGSGRLHFEVWQHKKAVNPAFYLKK